MVDCSSGCNACFACIFVDSRAPAREGGCRLHVLQSPLASMIVGCSTGALLSSVIGRVDGRLRLGGDGTSCLCGEGSFVAEEPPEKCPSWSKSVKVCAIDWVRNTCNSTSLEILGWFVLSCTCSIFQELKQKLKLRMFTTSESHPLDASCTFYATPIPGPEGSERRVCMWPLPSPNFAGKLQ